MSKQKNEEWSKIESSITCLPNTPEYREIWAEKRELFFAKHKYIVPPKEDIDQLGQYRDQYKKKRIFIIGNGPSLNKMPLELLKNEYTFCTNRFYLMYPKISWRPSFYTVCDWRVASDVTPEIDELQGTHKFYPERFRGLLKNNNDVTWYYHSPGTGDEAKFSFDATRGIRGAGSVTGSAIQLAFHMGFEKVYLIGCDADYRITNTVKQTGEDKFGNGIGFQLTSTQNDDPNHFDPSYFGTGRKWHDPNVPRMISGYEQCKHGFETANRQIFNATIGGKLEVFKRVDFYTLFENGHFYKKSDLSQFKFESGVSNQDNTTGPLITPSINDYIVGPYNRDDKVQIDESELIHHLHHNSNTTNHNMIDVGAHHGHSLVPFAKAGWNIIAFEPDPDNRKILENRIQNDWKIKLFSCALSDNPSDDCAFFGSDVSSGVSGLSPFLDSHSQKARVSVSTLASVCQTERVTSVDFLKIDTEGYDLMVLKGNSWRHIQPKIIICEFDEKKTNPLGYNYITICDYLADRGYRIFLSEWYPIERYGIKHSWRGIKQWPCQISDDEAWGNIVAFREPVDVTEIRIVTNLIISEKAENIRKQHGFHDSSEKIYTEAKQTERNKNKVIVKLRDEIAELRDENSTLTSDIEKYKTFSHKMQRRWKRMKSTSFYKISKTFGLVPKSVSQETGEHNK
jgi:FkbM family methyltransferase